MNLLVDALKDAVEINGVEYPILSDFRTGIQIMLDYEDENLTTYEKSALLVRRLYKVIPENFEEAFAAGLDFLNGGKSNKQSEHSGFRLYSFYKDGNLIHNAFMRTHNINLTDKNPHWWLFLSMFQDLGSDTAFCNLVNLRKRVKEGKATKDEKEIAETIPNFYLPEFENVTYEEHTNATSFWDALEGAA